MLGQRRGSFIVNQCRYAFKRNSSIHSGSFFLPEIKRIVSSLRPRGIVSDSMSVTQPYLYSRFVSISVVLIVSFRLRVSSPSALAEADFATFQSDVRSLARQSVSALRPALRLHQAGFVQNPHQLACIGNRQALKISELSQSERFFALLGASELHQASQAVFFLGGNFHR